MSVSAGIKLTVLISVDNRNGSFVLVSTPFDGLNYVLEHGFDQELDASH